MQGSIRHLMDPVIPAPLILLGLRQEEQGQEQLSKQSNPDHTCGNGDKLSEITSVISGNDCLLRLCSHGLEEGKNKSAVQYSRVKALFYRDGFVVLLLLTVLYPQYSLFLFYLHFQHHKADRVDRETYSSCDLSNELHLFPNSEGLLNKHRRSQHFPHHITKWWKPWVSYEESPLPQLEGASHLQRIQARTLPPTEMNYYSISLLALSSCLGKHFHLLPRASWYILWYQSNCCCCRLLLFSWFNNTRTLLFTASLIN